MTHDKRGPRAMTAESNSRGARRRMSLVILSVLVQSTFFACAAPKTDDPLRSVALEAANVIEENALYLDDSWDARREELLSAGESGDVDSLRREIQEATLAMGGRHSYYFAAGVLGPEETSDNATTAASIEILTSDVVMLKLPAYEGKDKETAYAKTALDELGRGVNSDTCGIIVDLRGNTGGNMFPMLLAASPLFDQEAVGSFRYRDGDTSDVLVSPGSISVGDDALTLSGGDAVDTIGSGMHIAVLQDSSTASAAEMVVTAFVGQPGVASFGEKTAGLTTANEAYTLTDGSVIVLSVAEYRDRNHTVINGSITPDFPTLSADAKDEASAWLRGQCT